MAIAWSRREPPLRAYLALAGAGFRRYSTYRQATVAAIVTNSVFGSLRCAIVFAGEYAWCIELSALT